MSSTFSLEGAFALISVKNILQLFGLWLGYRLLLALYNVSPFHPLAKFPGPKLAAASYLYEAWYDLILVGRYSWEIKDMHKKYGMSDIMKFFLGSRASKVKLMVTITEQPQGPIVRINPEELHCDDYDFVDEIYPSVSSRIRDKHQHFLNAFAGTLTVSTFTTPDHEVCF